MIHHLANLRTLQNRWRGTLLAVALVVFAIGLGISVRSLNLRWSQLSIESALLIVCILAPLTLVTASVSLQLTARALGRQIGLREGIAISAVGSIAELLPLPGGAIVRGAALVRAGAGLGESTWIVTLTAVLTLSMAATLGSVPLIASGYEVGYLFLIAGSGGAVVSASWIARRAGFMLALSMVALRLAALALAVVRVRAAFAAIDLAVGSIDASLFVIAATLGQAVSIVPAGLGLGEALAAALALLIELPASAAFVAVALNRILGLAVSGGVAIVLVLIPVTRRADSR